MFTAAESDFEPDGVGPGMKQAGEIEAGSAR